MNATKYRRHFCANEVEPLKEKCRKAEIEIMGLLRRVQEAQEGANRVQGIGTRAQKCKETNWQIGAEQRPNERNAPAVNESADC